MKCYVIHSQGDYVADGYRTITTKGWHGGLILNTTTDADSAKHYKSKTQPKVWLASTEKAMQKRYDDNKAEYAKQATKGNPYFTKTFKKNYESARDILNWILSASVIEVDVEFPSFDTKYKIMWDKWRAHRGDAGKSRMKLSIDTRSRHICKSCGLKLKNIPYYELVEGNPTKICIPCLYIRMDAIRSAFEGMPEDFRTNIVNELILGSM